MAAPASVIRVAVYKGSHSASLQFWATLERTAEQYGALVSRSYWNLFWYLSSFLPGSNPITVHWLVYVCDWHQIVLFSRATRQMDGAQLASIDPHVIVLCNVAGSPLKLTFDAILSLRTFLHERPGRHLLGMLFALRASRPRNLFFVCHSHIRHVLQQSI